MMEKFLKTQPPTRSNFFLVGGIYFGHLTPFHMQEIKKQAVTEIRQAKDKIFLIAKTSHGLILLLPCSAQLQ